MADSKGVPYRSIPWRLLTGAVLLALLVLFVAENFSTVEVRLIVAKTETRLAWALLLAGVLGFVAGVIVPRIRRP